jgi:hypothetical protein
LLLVGIEQLVAYEFECLAGRADHNGIAAGTSECDWLQRVAEQVEKVRLIAVEGNRFGRCRGRASSLLVTFPAIGNNGEV